ncbi:PQQ-dependent sugar dehydrogenase [Streptomyces sp. ODS28]|uniref:PQQ-dependent sugar dehydrogenase n=1 Tax=Streptomyces sp. ODS28 TaxID=3136688 RepID=UPI0031EF40EF
MWKRVAGVGLVAVLAVGCSGGGSGKKEGGAASSPPPHSSGPSQVKVERTVASGLNSPWGLVPLGGGDLLVSSRDTGKILRVDGKSGKKTELGTVPGVSPDDEGGLLGIAMRPGDDRTVYAYFTTAPDNRIVRMSYDAKKPQGRQLGTPDIVLKGIPNGPIHNGGRIAFGPDGMLYAGTGESGSRGLAQDRKSLGGKILRMTPEGKPPAQGNPDPRSVVYSYGHRNVQGLDWDADNRLWASEFGQDTWDELNLIRPGRDYGWPEAEGKAGKRGLTDPVEQWKPAEASPSGLAVAKGSAWMAGLRGERLWRIPLKGAEPAGKPKAFLKGEYGRLRTVVSDGRDGLWLVTSETDGRGSPEDGDDRILHLKVS